MFLAGDAAHVHSVNGGQGLNTGIADAFSLAWRLALVLKSSRLQLGAADTLLRSYDIERRQTAQGVIDVAAALVRDTVRSAKQYVGTIERNAGYITGQWNYSVKLFHSVYEVHPPMQLGQPRHHTLPLITQVGWMEQDRQH